MAYTLKASGIATNLVMCVAVDSDGTTIKEFVSADVDANKTLGTGVASGVGAASWKGTSRGYFPTLADGNFDYFGVRFAASHRPPLDAGSGHPHSVFIAAAGMAAGASTKSIIEAVASGSVLTLRSAGDKLRDNNGPHDGTTSLPTDNSTPFSCGYAHIFGTSYTMYYALESGSISGNDGTGADGGFGSDGVSIFGVGGASGQGNQPGKYHVVAVFNKALSQAEFQSLHGDGSNDWFSTLFDVGATGVTFPQLERGIRGLNRGVAQGSY